MVTVSLTIDMAALDGIDQYLDEIKQIAEEESVNAYLKYVAPVMAELTKQIAPPNYPIQWTSDKQRKFVMALLRRKARELGLPDDAPINYQRTGDIQDNWETKIKIVPTGTRMEFTNPTPYTKFVFGSLNQRSLSEARQTQQGFHADRYPLAAAVIGDGFASMKQEIETQIAKRDHHAFKLIAKRRSRQLKG